MPSIDFSRMIPAATRAAEAAAGAARAEEEAARALLAETDWMVLRAAETGKPVPPAILAQRAAARARLA